MEKVYRATGCPTCAFIRASRDTAHCWWPEGPDEMILPLPIGPHLDCPLEDAPSTSAEWFQKLFEKFKNDPEYIKICAELTREWDAKDKR